MECIIDLRPLHAQTGVTVEDVSKRLIDFGFHAPTVSFPVAGTLMVEPTESESKTELDRFIAAMTAIRTEIDHVADGLIAMDDSPPASRPPTPPGAIAADDWGPPLQPRTSRLRPARGNPSASTGPLSVASTAPTATRTCFCACPPMEDLQELGSSGL